MISHTKLLTKNFTYTYLCSKINKHIFFHVLIWEGPGSEITGTDFQVEDPYPHNNFGSETLVFGRSFLVK